MGLEWSPTGDPILISVYLKPISLIKKEREQEQSPFPKSRGLDGSVMSLSAEQILFRVGDPDPNPDPQAVVRSVIINYVCVDRKNSFALNL